MNKGCKIVKQMRSVKVIAKGRGLLNSIRIQFDKKPIRAEREMVDKCFRQMKIKSLWGDRSLIIR